MKKIIAIIILVFAVQGAAQAQIGKLLNKAKETVKKETKEAFATYLFDTLRKGGTL